MKTPEEFLREKYQHCTDYENGKFGFYEVISIIEEYQQQVKNLNIPAVINWAYFNENKPSYGDQILIQDPPEQMTTPRVEIYDRNTTWFDGSRYAVITPCL